METTTTRPTCEACKKPYRWEQYEHKCKACRKLEDLEYLRKTFPPGSTVHTNLVSVSRSGMSRLISVHCVDQDVDRKHLALKVGGCGMDMGFSVVYNLSATLYPNGFACIGRKPEHGHSCPANDHSNGDRNYRKGHQHKQAGGYALRHRWI
jgi:hypothetical protein